MNFENLSHLISKEKSISTLKFIQSRVVENSSISDGSTLHKSLKIPFLKIQIPSLNLTMAMNEARSLSDQFVEHRGGDSAGWSSLCLHGIDSFKTRHCEFYGYENETSTPYQWTNISQKCPVTTSWAKSLLSQSYFRRLYRVRFMKLKPGGFIKFHWDRPPGNNSLGPINFALNMPNSCYWLFESWGLVPFKAGDAFAVDVSNRHGVLNQSNEDRIHIIIHGQYGKAYYEALNQGHKSLLEKIRQGKFYD